jgi:HD superfamily phosphohydrolase
MYRTPTAMDIAEDNFVYAAKLLKGKINRSSNARVQITLSTDVAMEFLKNNPHLIDTYDKPFKIRPNLPSKFDFISYLKANTSIKDLKKQTDIAKTKIEHWFRKDNCFSYPTIEDWNKIKPFLKEIKFDDEMTFEIEEDWKS